MSKLSTIPRAARLIDYDGRRVNEALDSQKLTGGERYAALAPSGVAAHGASLILDGTKKVGVQHVDGQKGDDSYIVAFLPLAADERDYLVGRTIRLKVQLIATVGYLAAKPFTANTIQAVRGSGSLFDNVGIAAGARNEQVGTAIYREFDYVVTASDVQLGIVCQVSPTAGTAGNHSFRVVSATYEVVSSTGAETRSDVGLIARLKALGLYGLSAIVTALSASVAALSASVATLTSAATDNKIASPAITTFRSDVEALGGAVARTTGNPPLTVGVTIPANQSGVASYQAYKTPMGDYPAGTRLKILSFLKVSDNFLSTLNAAPAVDVRGSQGTGKQVAGTTSAAQVSINSVLLSGEYVTQGAKRELMGLMMQIGSTKAGGDAAERYFEHDRTFTIVMSSPDVVSSNSRALSSWGTERFETEYVCTVTVAADGTGDYTTVQSALANCCGRSFTKRGLIIVKPGVYDITNGVVPAYTDIVASGPQRDKHWLRGYLPPTSTVGTIANTQTLWVNRTCRIVGFKITAQNMRYTIHSDSGPSDYRATIEFIDCSIWHYGNADAVAYWGSGAGVWSATSALGAGWHSGQHFHSLRTDWWAENKPFYGHDTVGWMENAFIRVEGGRCIAFNGGTNGYSFDFKCLGSMRRTIVDIVGVEANCPINIDDKTGTSTGWLNTALSAQVANRMQITVNVWGARSMDWTSAQTNCQCLELRGPSGSATTPFVLSGTALASLMGDPDYRVSTGLPTRTAAYSYFAITSDVSTEVSLPQRLGDRSAAPWTLTIAGPVAGSITLDQNYAAMATNAEVINALNTKLSAAGLTTLSFYASVPYDERADVRHPDLETAIKNVDTATLGRGFIAAIGARFGEGQRTVAATTSIQFSAIVAGDVVQGAFGRGLRPNKGGLISQSHLSLTGSITPEVGMILYISSGASGALGTSPGTGNVAVLKCVEANRTSKPFHRWEFIA